MKHRDCVITLLFGSQVDDFKMSVFGGFLLAEWPVLSAFWSASFQTARRHNDDGALLFPNHPPKVPIGLGQWALGRDESVLLLIAVDIVSVYVVGTRIVGIFNSQDDSAVIIAENVRVTIFSRITF